MTGLKSVATGVKHVWAGAVIVATVLVVAGCEILGAEQTAPPPAATVVTRLPPATVTAVASKSGGAAAGRASTPAVRALASPAPADQPAVQQRQGRAAEGAGGTAPRATTPAASPEIQQRQVGAAEGAGATAASVVPTPSPVASPESSGVNRAATPPVPPFGTVRAWATARAAATRAALAAVTREVIREVETACTTGFDPMYAYASDDVARWTADGAHILLTHISDVWAATPDGSRVWRIARARREPVSGSDYPPGRAATFDVTRDGKHVVYATCEYLPDVPWPHDYELAVVGIDGQTARRLTRHEAFDNYPAWSPDGTRVAFVSNRDTSHTERHWRAGLYTMAADGAAVRRLAAGLEGVAWQPSAWSPDGRSLAVNGWHQDEGHGLYVVPADGAGFVRLADAVSGGAWSPDGTRLAFAQPERATVALYTIAADGTDVRARWVTTVRGWEPSSGVPDPREAWIHTVAWSPDGAKLLYACGERQFCVVTLDGQRLGRPCQGWADGPACYTRDGRQLVGTSLIGDRAVWSPDGARIAVTTPGAPERRHGDDFLGPYPIILYSAAPDGSDVKPLVLGGEESISRVRSLIAAQAAEEDLAKSRAACTGGFVVPAPDTKPGLVRDCETLTSARAALFYGQFVNWGSGSPLDLWEGVTISGAPPRVTGLDLSSRRLRGTIPPELGQLTHLKELYLHDNALAGPIPAEMGALSHLTELSLGGNRLTGCIPSGLRRVDDHDLAELGLLDCEGGA